MKKTHKDGFEFDPQYLDRDRAIEGNEPHYLWCLHCERAYLRGKYRQVGNLQMCFYPECSGDSVIDAWDWETVRENNPGYPENPVEGQLYPLYGSART